MRRFVSRSLFFTFLFAASAVSFAQGDYKVVTVTDGGTISGTVKICRNWPPRAPTIGPAKTTPCLFKRSIDCSMSSTRTAT